MNTWKRVAGGSLLAVFWLLTAVAAGGEERAGPPADAGAAVISPQGILSGAQKRATPLPLDVQGMRLEIREKGFTTVYIEFAVNSAVISPESGGQMQSVGTLLREETAWCLRIVGHTDSIGEAAYNLELSRERASSVRRALLDAGIAAKRLTAEGMGEEQPVADNKSPEGRARNRRVELIRADCP